MAEILLNKIVNDEIDVEPFIKWLLGTSPQAQIWDEFADLKCSRTDFLTYFLNFVHEEIPCHNRCVVQKTASKRVEGNEDDNLPIKKPFSFHENGKVDMNKSASYPLSLNKSVDVYDASRCSSMNSSQITSTPEMHRMPSDSVISDGYFSPISPLYKAQNSFNTPKTKRQSNVWQKSGDKASPLCLGDFIINRKPSGKKKASRCLINEENGDESSKRIKPTSLSQVKVNNGFRKAENSFNNFQDTKEVENLKQSRNFLAEERLKILSRKNSGDNLVLSTKKISLMSFKAEFDPDPELVTNKRQVGYLVDIYKSILHNNCVLNVNSEIYFLISLLLSKQFGPNDVREDVSTNSSEDFQALLSDDDRELRDATKRTKLTINASDLFEPIHNVIYFASKCLESQGEVLRYYDRSTLKLLSSNGRLRVFARAFAEKLARIAEKKQDRTMEVCESDLQTNVCFNSDTDNRANFPSDVSFHSFRKQRDLFYEILRVWENNHLLPGWSFGVSLGGKIRGLLGLQGEPANFVHFSRLFKAQLLSTCGRTQKEEGLSENQLPFLSSLPNVDADKLNRLKSRLVTKQSSNGINPLPTFTGHQEFYRDFIVVAGNYAFNKHLCDTLVAEIVELNDTGFSCTDLDESDSDIDPSTQKAYLTSIKSLRVLAKFLGFIESLPYKSECCNYTHNLLATQLKVRQQTAPSFDVREILVRSINRRNLIATIPWITEYVAMLDYVSLRLPYYISFHKILFDLYKNYEIRNSRSSYSISLIRFCLGWLFELPHFPDSEYFNFCTDPKQNDRQILTNGHSAQKIKCKKSKNRSLDDLDMIDQNVLYVCCPYLEEIKILLSSNALNSNVTVKHITPVTAVQSSNEIARKRLEQQLEEAFFNGQPISVRKTVEFVCERVASTCVKHICNTVVPTLKKSALQALKNFLVSWKDQQSVMSPAKDKSNKGTLKLKVNQMAQNRLKSLRDECEKEVSDMARTKIPPAVDNLLAVDVLPQSKDVCHSITIKMCLERVRQWMDSHLTLGVFTKDFDSELQRSMTLESRAVKDKPVFMLPPGGSGKKHNESSTSAFHLLEKLKEISVEVLENPVEIDEKFLLRLLEESYVTLTERCDVNECIMTYTCSLLLDLSLLLVTYRPEIMTNVEILDSFIRVWRCKGEKTSDLFKNLLSPRNTMLLSQSRNAELTWEVFAKFVAFLIKENVLACDDFESQCTGFFKKDWDQGSLKNFSSFLRKFVDCYKCNGGPTHKFTFLLGFLSDFCSDL